MSQLYKMESVEKLFPKAKFFFYGRASMFVDIEEVTSYQIDKLDDLGLKIWGIRIEKGLLRLQISYKIEGEPVK